MQVVATSLVAEHISPLIEMFAAAHDGMEIAVEPVPGDTFADRLEHRRADIALGPHPGAERVATIASAPFLRCRQIIVAAPAHPLAGRRGARPRRPRRGALADRAARHRSQHGRRAFFERNGLDPAEIGSYGSHAAAVAAAAAGEGLVLTPAHSVVEEVRRRSLVRIDVRGTPTIELWHASTLGLGRALPAALALQRFATTGDATQAISTGRAGAITSHARPKVHVTLWRSVAAEIDAANG